MVLRAKVKADDVVRLLVDLTPVLDLNINDEKFKIRINDYKRSE